MCSETQTLAQAQRVYATLKPVRIDGIPATDLKDRLSVLTVAGEVREVGAIGFAEANNEGMVRRIRDLLVNCGLRTKLTLCPLHRTSKLQDEFPPEVLQPFDESDVEDCRQQDGRLLWAYTDNNNLENIRRCLVDEQMIGPVLGYPECCVQREVERKRIGQRAFVQAMVKAVGADTKKIEAALKENLKVAVPDEAFRDVNMYRTDERFPFILHTACDTCLEQDESASAAMNEVYEDFARKIDPAFHHAICDIVATSLERTALLNMHTLNWLTRDELGPGERRKLVELDERCELTIQKLLRPS